MIGWLALLALIPTPIGRGPEVRPPAPARGGEAVGALTCGRPGHRFGVHVELFARGQVVIVPSGIGVARPRVRDGAYVVPRGCTYPVRTVEPTGVLEVGRRGLRLADLFRVWNRPLSPARLVSFRGRVRAYVGGRPWRGAPGAIPLTRHAQIVLEVGPYIPPHAKYTFRPGL